MNYGASAGVDNDTFIKGLDEIEQSLKQELPGVTFKDDSGSYTFNSIFDVLYVGMNYKNMDIYQYYLVSGGSTFIFTFFGVDQNIAQTVLSTFSIM